MRLVENLLRARQLVLVRECECRCMPSGAPSLCKHDLALVVLEGSGKENCRRPGLLCSFPLVTCCFFFFFLGGGRVL